jgi:hypothetical protein
MSVYPYQLSNGCETVIMKLGMYITAPELISTTYFINSSIAARQRLGKTLPRQQIHTQKKEELLEASFSMRSLQERKVGD